MVGDLNTNMGEPSNGNSAQLAGLARACFFFIPFAVKYGRRPVYIASTALMAGGCFWTSLPASSPGLSSWVPTS